MIGISIIARLESTRLTQKHLIEANGKPFLEWLVLRLQHAFQKEISSKEVEICITTSETQVNKTFLQFESIEGVCVFFGNNNNIPIRMMECVSAKNWDGVISVDGDDILCSPLACRKVFDALKSGKEYVKTEGLPLGMNASGFSATYLKEAVKNTPDKLETGWGRIFNVTPTVVSFEELTNEPLRFTLDYSADADFFKAIVISLGNDRSITATDEEIVDDVISNNLNSLNSQLNDIYWENFNNQIEKEKDE